MRLCLGLFLLTCTGAGAQDLNSLLESKVNPDDYAIKQDEFGLHAPNPIQNLEARFRPDGVVLAPHRTDEALKTGALVRLRTAAWGRAHDMRRLDEMPPVLNGLRVEYQRPGITEWYSNRPGGLEQGFEVTARPSGDGALCIELEVQGARATQRAGEVLVVTDCGRQLNLGGLVVKDALKKDVGAHFQVDGLHQVALVIDDSSATYPLSVDPVLADDCWRSGFGTGMNGLSDWVNAAVTDASGNLYVGGRFTFAGSVTANCVAKWNGSSWSALGTGVNGEVCALAVSGSDLYAGGEFTSAGYVAVNHIAKYDGTSWSALGSGIPGHVYALAVSGSNLYVGGDFTNSSLCNFAKWDGSSWSALGNNSAPNGTVYAIAICGGYLYAGGSFNGWSWPGGGVTTGKIAKWDGYNWSAVGTGIWSYPVYALVANGSDLYAGGAFSAAGGITVNGIAKWDGSTWSALGTGMDREVQALAVGGSGNVYAGGYFTTAGGVNANCIAKWNGSNWSALGTGTDNEVATLAVSGSDLYAGGKFITAGGKASYHIAQWSEPAHVATVGVTPGSGPSYGGQRVTITGTGYVTSGSIRATFGGEDATAVTPISSTQFSCTTPAHALGVVDLVVTNPDGWQGTQVNAYTYQLSPRVANVFPTHGPSTLTQMVTITGDTFVNPVTVTFGDVLATGVNVVNLTTIICTTPIHPAGQVNLVVTNPDTHAGVGTNIYTFDPAPGVASVSPDYGATTRTTNVTITGSNFVSPVTVTFDGIPATGVATVSPSTIACTTPLHDVGAVAVAVYNPDGQMGSLPAGFNYATPPTLTAVDPNVSNQSGRYVHVTGTGFAITGTVHVSFGGNEAAFVSVTSATQLSCTTPAHPVGTVDVVVTNPDGLQGIGAALYTYIEYEGDVSPRSTQGDSEVSVADWVQLGRFAAKLDTPDPGIEFQKADCSPYDTKGDGYVGVGDWVEVGRFAAKLDPKQTAGGPSAP